jgi:hypothetical protein
VHAQKAGPQAVISKSSVRHCVRRSRDVTFPLEIVRGQPGLSSLIDPPESDTEAT